MEAVNDNAKKMYGDAGVIRLIAAQVLVLSILALWSGSQIVIGFLVFDFAIRAFTYSMSPLKWSAQKLSKGLGSTPRPIFLPPKRFAALLGFMFSSFWLLFLLLSWPVATLVIGITLIVAASLEAFFEICLGCYVYNWVISPLMQRLRS